MGKTERRKALKCIMNEYGVSITEVAEILDRTPGTIRNWRTECGENTAPPNNELRLLKFELEARKGNKK